MIAIVGGGIAGLAAAYELTLRQRPFTLLEASPRLGGLIRTERVDGFTIEAGADSLLAQKGAGLQLCRELGLESRLMTTRRPRGAFVLHQGRLHPLPSPAVLGIPASARALATASLLPPYARLRIALEPLVPPQHADDESIARFFERRFGRRTVDLLAQPLLGGIHAGDVHRLSIRALFPRLAQAEHRRGRVLRWIRESAGTSGTEGAFRSLIGGMGELVDALAARLPSAGVHRSARVEHLERRADRWRLRAGDLEIQADAVILACPAHVIAPLLRNIDAASSSLCAEVPYVSTVSVALAWPRAAVRHPLTGSGFVVARSTSGQRLTACTWVSSKWEHRAPEGTVLLRAYMGGAHDPGAVDESDDRLIAAAVAELSPVLSIAGPPTFARVYRWREAGAQHETGHRGRIATLEKRLTQLGGLFVTGSGFRVTGVPDCIADGRAVALQASRG